MDYKTLLAKYIAYVVDCEGIDYIEGGYRGYTGDTEFTKDEWAELHAIATEGKYDDGQV